MYRFWFSFATWASQKENLVHLSKKKREITLQSFIYPVTMININFFFIMTPEAERFNGWAAMLGFVAAVGAYVTTGQIIPGWF